MGTVWTMDWWLDPINEKIHKEFVDNILAICEDEAAKEIIKNLRKKKGVIDFYGSYSLGAHIAYAIGIYRGSTHKPLFKPLSHIRISSWDDAGREYYYRIKEIKDEITNSQSEIQNA